MNLNKLFCPESIAVVGASDRPGSFGCHTAINAMKSNAARVYLVNPKKNELNGCRTYASLPDAAKEYIRYLEEAVQCPIRYVSVGAGRDEYIELA